MKPSICCERYAWVEFWWLRICSRVPRSEIEKLIVQVKQLGVPIVGVISDKQESICLAVERQLSGVPHQLCHYHYLKDLAQPVCEADRTLKKELKKKIRQIRPVERAAEQLNPHTPEAQVVKDYCLAIRTVSQQQGKYPYTWEWSQSIPKTPSDRGLPQESLVSS